MTKRFLGILLVLAVVIAAFLPSCAPTTGTIEVKATLDGAPWTGAVAYTLTPTQGSPINGTQVDKTFTVTPDSWTCAYVSGGPVGANFVNITPAATQSVAAGATTNFTLNFVTLAGLKQVDAYVTFKGWTINGTPVVPAPGQVIWIPHNTWIDAEYEEHVSGQQEGEVVTVHQTSWLKVHNTGEEGSGQGMSMWLHAVNHPKAVTMTPPPESKANQQCTVGGVPVPACTDIELKVCQPVWLDVEVDWELKICTNYTKTINWIGYPSPEEILFDAAAVPPFHTVTLVTWACVEVGEGFEDTNPDNNCSANSTTMIIGFVP